MPINDLPESDPVGNFPKCTCDPFRIKPTRLYENIRQTFSATDPVGNSPKLTCDPFRIKPTRLYENIHQRFTCTRSSRELTQVNFRSIPNITRLDTQNFMKKVGTYILYYPCLRPLIYSFSMLQLKIVSTMEFLIDC